MAGKKCWYGFLFVCFTFVCSSTVPAVTCQWPNASNVGLTNPGILSSSPSVTLQASGTFANPVVFQNKNVQGQITVQASNIIIRNCRVWGGLYGIHLKSGSNIIVENCEIGKTSPTRMKGINTGASKVTIRRNYFHYVGDGIALSGSDVVIEDNFMTKLICVDNDHNDGIQIFGGRNHLIKHNWIELPNQQTACVGQHGAIVSGLRIEGNYFNGGTYSIYTRQKDGPVSGVSVVGNYFGRDHIYGLHSNDVQATINCNRYLDNNAPAFGPQTNCQQYSCTFQDTDINTKYSGIKEEEKLQRSGTNALYRINGCRLKPGVKDAESGIYLRVDDSGALGRELIVK
jgi:parallel beta-helix repeat protein